MEVVEVYVQVNMGFSPSRISLLLHLSWDYFVFCPTHEPKADKIPHIPHTLQQVILTLTANNTSISSGSRRVKQTARSRCLGLEPDALKRPSSPFFTFEKTLYTLQTHLDVCISALWRGALKSSLFTSVTMDEQTDNVRKLWIFILYFPGTDAASCLHFSNKTFQQIVHPSIQY